MKKHTGSLQSETFYHVFNRGINREDLFKTEENYVFFLHKYAAYIEPVATTYAYCLLKNHFHLLVRTKSEEEILRNLVDVKDLVDVNHKPVSFYISNQFAKLFNSYTQSINKANNRTGGLFETPFRRIEVNNDAYFSKLITYIHLNPQQHGLTADFRDYMHSSYHSHLHLKTTRLQREQVLNWFGNAEQYKQQHSLTIIEKEANNWAIDFD